MASKAISTTAAIAVIVVILVGAGVGYALFSTPGAANTTQSSSSSQTSSSVSTTSKSTSGSSTQAGTSSTVKTTSTTSTAPEGYALTLVESGSLIASSNLTTPQGPTYVKNDTDTESYDGWLLTGDFQPGSAWFSVNNSGLTLTQETMSGPYQRWWGDHKANMTEVNAEFGVPSNTTLYSIYVNIPNYDYFSSCVYNNQVSIPGCSYQSGGPTLIANFALNAYTKNGLNTVMIAIGEATYGLAIGAETTSMVNGTYVATQILYSGDEAFAPMHKLTIATDRHSYLEFFLDNRSIYSTTTLPVDLNGSRMTVSFQQDTSINNETLSTVWSNFTAYSGSTVTVKGLPSGAVAHVSGPSGFNASAPAGSDGTAVLDVSVQPIDLSLNVRLSDGTLVTYNGTLVTGSVLELETH